MSTSIRWVGSLAVVAAVLAVPAGAAERDETRGLTVVGTGEVTAVPDVAEWSFGVEARASTATRALSTSSATIRRVVAALRAAGVARNDIQTQDASLYPRMNRRNDVSGYVATSRVRAAVRDLRRAGAVIEGAVEAGATDVFGPALSASHREDLLRRALDEAFEEAKAKAERLAAKVGVTLGRPVAIVERGGFDDNGAIYEAAGAALEIEPGEQEIVGMLTVTFAIS
ncbi:MAG: SIMPL domain-containing protein [Actinomycetota bacterium]|nr:SIMPL domain-containing protein [Actinomycetota bacterium]